MTKNNVTVFGASNFLRAGWVDSDSESTGPAVIRRRVPHWQIGRRLPVNLTVCIQNRYHSTLPVTASHAGPLGHGGLRVADSSDSDSDSRLNRTEAAPSQARRRPERRAGPGSARPAMCPAAGSVPSHRPSRDRGLQCPPLSGSGCCQWHAAMGPVTVTVVVRARPRHSRPFTQ